MRKKSWHMCMTPINNYHPSFRERFVFRRAFPTGSDAPPRHLLWSCNTIDTYLLTLSNHYGALYHIFCDESGCIYLDPSIIRYVLTVPAISEYVSISECSEGRYSARIRHEHLNLASLRDKSIYLLLLNSPWGCSEGIFSHYYEEFVPFLHQLSLMCNNCSAAPIWLSWKNEHAAKASWRDDCDAYLASHLGTSMPKAMHALYNSNTFILKSACDLHVSISRFRLKCVGWSPGSGISRAVASFSKQVKLKTNPNSVTTLVILTRVNYSGERRWCNENQCAAYLGENSNAKIMLISPEHHSTQELIGLIPGSATIITAPSSAVYPLLLFGSKDYNFVVVEFPGESTSFGGSLSGELSSYRLCLNGIRNRIFFFASENYSESDSRNSYSVRPSELLSYLFSIRALTGHSK